MRLFSMGIHLTQQSLFIFVARLIWGIDFELPVDQNTGHSIIPDIHNEGNFSEGFITGPNPFRAGFRARSEKHAALINSSFEDAQSVFVSMGLAKDERPEFV